MWLVGYGATDVSAVAAAIDWRAYEKPLPEFLARLALGIPGAFYDVGANTGFYATLVGRLCPATTIVAFEPMPPISAMCSINLANNAVDAALLTVAVSDREGFATIHVPDDGHGLVETSASLNAHFKGDTVATLSVPTVTVDGVNARRNDELVGLMKVDVEGHEHAVLAGCSGVAERDRPLIVIEILPGAEMPAIAAFLARHDYLIAPLHDGSAPSFASHVRFDADAWNQLLVPRERESEVLAVLADAAAMHDALANAAQDTRDVRIATLESENAWLFSQWRDTRGQPEESVGEFARRLSVRASARAGNRFRRARQRVHLPRWAVRSD